MRNIFTPLILLISLSSSAQFSIQPQAGLETSRTTVNYNGQSILLPTQFTPKLGMLMQYKFKGGGPYLGISTSSPSVNFNFSDPQIAGAQYSHIAGNLRMRFEAGYQFSTKAINFSGAGSSSNRSPHNCSGMHFCPGKIGCHHGSSCNRNHQSSSKNSSYMKIIPSIGVAYIPGQNSDESVQSTAPYHYTAGAWNTALVAGTGLEFGNKGHANFTLNFNYLKGLGNLGSETVNTVSGGKATSSMFSSNTSGFSVSLGFPLNFGKKHNDYIKKELERLEQRTEQQKKCGQFYKMHHCGQARMFMQ